MDSAHLLQQILFISAVLEAEIFTFRMGDPGVQEIPNIYLIKLDIESSPAKQQHFRILIMNNISAAGILPLNH